MHSLFLEVQKRLGLSIVELQRLSDTRRTCQVAGCAAVMKSFPAILVYLAEIIATKSKRSIETGSLFEQLNISFLFHLSLFTRVLSRLKILRTSSKGKDCDLVRACIMERAAIDELSEIRNSEDAFDSAWMEGYKIAEENGMPSKQAQRVTCLPSHLEQYVLTEGRLIEDVTCYTKEEFRVKVFLPVVDHIVVELTMKLTKNSDVVSGASAFHPRSEKFLDISYSRLLQITIHVTLRVLK